MALNWSLKNVEDYEAITTDDEWPITEALIFATMGVDMGEITEKNFDEFMRRLTIWQAAIGGMIYQYGVNLFITADDVRKRIGLRTNVYTEPKTSFNKKVIDVLLREGEAKLRNQDWHIERAKKALLEKEAAKADG